MGTPTPPVPPPGDVCANCDGILWPVGVTPKFVKAEATGLEPCPNFTLNAPNGIWWLEQTAVGACIWYYEDNFYYFALELTAENSGFAIAAVPDIPLWSIFLALEGPCAENYTNLQDACGGNKGCIHGTVIVHWPGP